MDVADSQASLRRAYVGGGPGAIVSGMVWGLAALTRVLRDTPTAFAVLFLGGMLIFPLSAAAARVVFRRTESVLGNALGPAAFESTIAMIGGLFTAWLFLPFKPALVFPIAAIAVGTHYAVFRTVYGDRSFLLLAAAITCSGLAGVYIEAVSEATIIALVALIEIGFGAVLTIRALRN